MDQKSKVGHIQSLDGWRAISITLVLLSHEWATSNVPNIHFPWSMLLSQGSLGVRIFFVISGYLITHLMIREVNVTGDFSLRKFYIRRIIRIFPVYYLYLAVLAVMQFAGLFHDTASSWLGALTFTRNVVGNGHSPTGHLWSLAVEEQFYVAWPITFSVLALYKRHRLAIIILLLVITTAFIARLNHCSGTGFVCKRILNVNSAIYYADCLAIGCLGAVVVDALEQSGLLYGTRFANTIGLASTAGLFVSALPLFPVGPLSWSVLVTTQAVLTMVAVHATTRGGILAIPLNAAPVVALGVTSYSLYIWHMLFLANYLPGLGGMLVDDWRMWWLPAFIVAQASYYLYERRFLALRQKSRPAPLPID